ncbi:isopentenyl-diphosphate delta-isomerase [Trichonephila inaurata madagascariensis]|uniref:Isopentenyl-diphosphate delta-isomerase n=1 Tax=Trichonephila inaurata madagascariensis TaxID=2747483 RepID=A0A8X7C884_9ARAC|nr:isopentenyl-diphosphate delta-isomerase [Trichonephila inaurata madagascariensis]
MSKNQNLDIERKQDHIEINLPKNVEFTLKSELAILTIGLQRPPKSRNCYGAWLYAGFVNEKPDTIKTFAVRDVAPDIPLLANIGAVQLNYGVTPKECQYLVDVVKADALILHLNVLQELTQPEGNRNWENLHLRVINYLSVPVIVKEEGYGLSKQVAKKLIGAGVKVLDIAGSGGTSWSQVEAYRATNSLQNLIASSFINWGIPTLDSLKMVREVSKDIPIIASGGLKSGIDGAKAIRMGANIFGLAGQLLKAAHTSESLVSEEIQLIIEQLKITMTRYAPAHVL